MRTNNVFGLRHVYHQLIIIILFYQHQIICLLIGGYTRQWTNMHSCGCLSRYSNVSSSKSAGNLQKMNRAAIAASAPLRRRSLRQGYPRRYKNCEAEQHKRYKTKYQPTTHPCCIWRQLWDGWTQGYLANISLRLRAHSLEMKLYDIAEGIHKVEPCDNYSEEECEKACLRRRRT